jgi:hypothetical protein
MRTRSGKTYEFNKCQCGKYYKTPIFHNRCSQCFSIKYPEKWQKIIKDQWTPAHHIPSNMLECFLDEYAIDAKNTLKLIQYTIIQVGIAPSRSISVIFQILNHCKNKGKLGIRAKDAADIYRKFNETYGNKFGRNDIGIGQGSDWRIQHLIAGLILDYWNITSNDHGPVAYCYYGQLGNKPRGLTTDILPCTIMLRNSNIHNHRLKFRFWAESTNNIRPMAANS